MAVEQTVKGEVYKVTLSRSQELVLEIEIGYDGEAVDELAWQLADENDWETFSDEVYAIEQITCGGEV